jgi:hypothetical protein
MLGSRFSSLALAVFIGVLAWLRLAVTSSRRLGGRSASVVAQPIHSTSPKHESCSRGSPADAAAAMRDHTSMAAHTWPHPYVCDGQYETYHFHTMCVCVCVICMVVTALTQSTNPMYGSPSPGRCPLLAPYLF